MVCRCLFYLPGNHSTCSEERIPNDLSGAFLDLTAQFVCPSCAPCFTPVESPVCKMCGIMFQSREGYDHLCGECRKTPKKYTTARAAAVYDDFLRTAILDFKYREKTGLAKPLENILFAAFVTYFSENKIDLVIPVPLYIKRFRQRGFNQSFLLIVNWAEKTSNSNYLNPFQVCNHALERCRQTKPQAGLNRRERVSNLKNAFTLRNPSAVIGKNILLVDDVYTTGSTVNECAGVLLKGGAKRVDVLTLARAM
jgi:ComF family protein